MDPNPPARQILLEAETGVWHTQLPRFRAASILATKIVRAILYVFSFLLPSWLHSQPRHNSCPVPPRLPRPTAYLDGLRGIVSVLVFVRHFSLPWQPHLDYGYGYSVRSEQGTTVEYKGILRLPFLRLAFSGPLVPVFFVISGYVLSAKPLRLGQTREWGMALQAISVSAFRRPIRLFLPPLVSTLVVMLLASLHCFAFDYGRMPGRIPAHPAAADSLQEQAAQWLSFSFTALMNPWRWDVPAMLYGPHLWTIPVSFKGSLVVFLACLSLIRVRRPARMGLVAMLMLTTWLHGRYHMAPFLGGMLLCDWDLGAPRPGDELGELKASFPRPLRARVQSWASCICMIMGLVYGLYLGSFPRYNDHGRACVVGYRWYCAVTPDYHYWHGMSALLIMYTLSRLRACRWPLESAWAQYLGGISYSTYIVHEPFLHLVAFFAVPALWHVTGEETQLEYQTGLALAMLVCLVLLVWLADLFKMYVETPCIRLSEKLERLCLLA